MVRDTDIRAAVRKAATLDPRPFQVCPGFWAAASQSKPGHGYLLEIAEGHVRCECAGFEHRGCCAHAAFVAVELGLMPSRFLLDQVREVEPAPVRVGGLHGRRSLYGQEGA